MNNSWELKDICNIVIITVWKPRLLDGYHLKPVRTRKCKNSMSCPFNLELSDLIFGTSVFSKRCS